MNKEQKQRIGSTIGIVVLLYVLLAVVTWGYAKLLYDLRKRQIQLAFPKSSKTQSVNRIGETLSGFLGLLTLTMLFLDALIHGGRGGFSNFTLYTLSALVIGGLGCTVFYLLKKVFLFINSIVNSQL